MSCACIRGTFDFDLTYTNCSDIKFLDRSTWQEGYTDVPTYTLKITAPGGFKQTYQVTKGIPLHLDFGSCPDSDLYLFEVETCGEPFSKNFPILCTLECGYLRAVAKLGQGIDLPTLRSIRERIEYIKQATAFGDIVTARELVATTTKDLKRINCDCSCF